MAIAAAEAASERRAAVVDRLLAFNDDDGTFLDKTARLVEELKIATPSCTVTFKVGSCRACSALGAYPKLYRYLNFVHIRTRA